MSTAYNVFSRGSDIKNVFYASSSNGLLGTIGAVYWSSIWALRNVDKVLRRKPYNAFGTTGSSTYSSSAEVLSTDTCVLLTDVAILNSNLQVPTLSNVASQKRFFLLAAIRVTFEIFNLGVACKDVIRR